MTLRRMLRAVILAVLLSALVYAVLVVMSDWHAVSAALTGFSPLVMLAVIALATLGYFVRALRWRALMRSVGYPVTLRDACYLQFSGQTMGVSPGRVGEVLKPWLARDLSDMPMGKGIALVFAERVADLLAVCLLSLGGLSLLAAGGWWLAGALGLLLAGTLVMSSAWFHRLALKLVCKTAWTRRHHEAIASIAETIRSSLHWRTLAWSTPAALVAWGLEGIGFALCVRGLGFDGSTLPAIVSVYAVSAIVGAFTFLPGGIGFTEASMVGIMVALGMSAADASAATLLIRVATLWWGVVMGWAVLATRPVVFKRLFTAEVE